MDIFYVDLSFCVLLHKTNFMNKLKVNNAIKIIMNESLN